MLQGQVVVLSRWHVGAASGPEAPRIGIPGRTRDTNTLNPEPSTPKYPGSTSLLGAAWGLDGLALETYVL